MNLGASAARGVYFRGRGARISYAAANIDRKTQFPLVQVMRGLAALWVVLFHAEQGGHIPHLMAFLPGLFSDVMFKWGHFGVPVFFALSGFVIAHSLRGIELSPRTLGRFALRRSVRLDPPYWASMALVLAMSYISARIKSEQFSFPDASNLLAHVLYLQVILKEAQLSPAYWTLTYEIQFYLFFATMLMLGSMQPWGRRGRTIVWLIMFALALFSAAHSFAELPSRIFLSLWASFFTGVLAYKAVEHGWARLLGALLLLVIAWSGDDFMLASAATAQFLLVTTILGLSRRPSIVPAGQWLGKISYSLYLIHSPVTGAAAFICHRLLGSSILADTATLAIVLAACLLCSHIFWALVEFPSQRWTKKFALRRSAHNRCGG